MEQKDWGQDLRKQLLLLSSFHGNSITKIYTCNCDLKSFWLSGQAWVDHRDRPRRPEVAMWDRRRRISPAAPGHTAVWAPSQRAAAAKPVALRAGPTRTPAFSKLSQPFFQHWHLPALAWLRQVLAVHFSKSFSCHHLFCWWWYMPNTEHPKMWAAAL